MDAYDLDVLDGRDEDTIEAGEQETNIDADFDDLFDNDDRLPDTTDPLPDVPSGREEREGLTKEIVFKKLVGEEINRRDGRVSRQLLDNLEIVRGDNGTVNGLRYKGKRVVISDRRGGYAFSNSKGFKSVKDEFFKPSQRQHHGAFEQRDPRERIGGALGQHQATD